MKQRNFRDVEYLKKSQKDISDKINGALDSLEKQRSTGRPISAPSKGSFIMKAASQARFQIDSCLLAASKDISASIWKSIQAFQSSAKSGRKAKTIAEKARH